VTRRLFVRAKTFWQPKGNEERFIPLHGAFYELLRVKERKSNWVFAKADGRQVNIHSLEARFKNQLKRLRIQNATPHTWRHAFASHLTMLTGNLRTVQVLLGHKSGRTAEIYSHLADRYLQTVVNQLPSPDLGTIWAQKRDCVSLMTGRGSRERRSGDCAATALVMAIGNEGLPSLIRFRRRPYD
jgi:integrase